MDSRLEEFALQPRHLGDIFRSAEIQRIGILANRSLSGTRRITKHTIELLRHLLPKPLSDFFGEDHIRHARALTSSAQCPHSFFLDFIGNDDAPTFAPTPNPSPTG